MLQKLPVWQQYTGSNDRNYSEMSLNK